MPPPLPPRDAEPVPPAPPKKFLAELDKTQQTFQSAALLKVLEVNETIPETISGGPPAWNDTFDIQAKFAMHVTQTDLIVKIRLKMPDVKWGVGAVPAKNVWSSKIGIAWAGCSLYWKPMGSTTEQEYPIRVEVDVVDSGEHHTITAQHPSTVGHGATVGLGGTTGMTDWGVLDSIDIAHEVGHMLGNPENYYTVQFRGSTKIWGAARQTGKGIMNNPAEPPLAEHFWLVREKFPALMTLHSKQGAVSRLTAPPSGSKAGWTRVKGKWIPS